MIGLNNFFTELAENGRATYVLNLNTGNMMVEADFNGVIYKKEFNNEPDNEEFEEAKEIIGNSWTKLIETREVLLNVKETIKGIRDLSKSYNTLKNCIDTLEAITPIHYTFDVYVIGAKIITLMALISSPMNNDKQFEEVMVRKIYRAYNEVIDCLNEII